MKGYRVVWPAAGRIELADFTLPALKPGDVLIETEYSAISAGTEKAWLKGMPNTSGKFPQYPGYSASGRILEAGSDVEGLKAGDRVICYYTGHASHAVKPAEGLVKIEDPAVSSLEAAFFEIASIAMQGVRKARLELGESVLVMGQGLLGLLAVQFAQLSGGLPVIAADLNEARRQLSVQLGADHALSPMDEYFREAVEELTQGRKANAVIEVTGVAVALKQALACTARQGRVILLGCTRINDAFVDFYKDVHLPGISLIGAHQFVRPDRDSHPGYWTRQDEFRTLHRLLSAGKLKLAPMISEVTAPENAPMVYKRLIEEEHAPLGIAFHWTKREE
ncbi:zinc-dependent alcohol dehydrogenase [Paenibacillus cymbidii]|uniref:zinc-dependent alcohol dehydrogenase n=1 Tax=Paenibacillus cymbidii TaxID=1639034 RepID=UPI0010804A77|nr:zinc-binding alcohol dehydrogenase [Paenibacillus cymbidii]